MKHIIPGIGLLFLLNMATAQIKVPDKIIGNWINTRSNDWEYGFFENFAVYKSDFWEYGRVEEKKNQVWITLKKGTLTESFKITTGKDKSPLVITSSKGKARYNLDHAGGTPYPMADHRPFRNSGFKPDTVTIIGYYRNLDKYLEAGEDRRYKGPFKVSVPDFIQDEEVIYHADFDAQGRFTVKFPVLNTQQVFIDLGRLTQVDVVEPGETIFLYADLAGYIDMKDWLTFRNNPKDILYMGNGSRLHNELAAYPQSTLYFDRQQTVAQGATDLEYLKAARSTSNTRLRHLEAYIKNNPAVSDRFRVFHYAAEKYNLLFNLMQHGFDKPDNDIAFENGYMAFVDSLMAIPDEKHFTLVRDCATVMTDYTAYYEVVATLYKDEKTGQMMLRGASVTDADVLMDMKERRTFSEHDKEIISRYYDLTTTIYPKLAELKDDTAKIAALFKPYEHIHPEAMKLMERLGISDSLPEIQRVLVNKKLRIMQLAHIDTLIHNDTLKQLLMAKEFYQAMENGRVALSKAEHRLLKEKVTIRPLYDYIMGVNSYYVSLGNKQLSYRSSLKNTDHLKEAKDAELLFQGLISPYKGKVIYMDFWGTWCGPCREQMTYVDAVKKEFEGQDVIFMYLANNSPEDSWNNVIKQMNLTGENVVHYRLPAEQQAMIERKFSVDSFPTYLLFDKDGNLAQDNAPPPGQKAELVSKIIELLED